MELSIDDHLMAPFHFDPVTECKSIYRHSEGCEIDGNGDERDSSAEGCLMGKGKEEEGRERRGGRFRTVVI